MAAATSEFNCRTGVLTGTRVRSGSKRGLVGYGSGFSYPGDYIPTQQQSQSVVDDQQPWFWYNYLLFANGVTLRSGAKFIPYFGNDMRTIPGSLTPFNQAGIDQAVSEAGAGGYIFFGGEIDQGAGGGPALQDLIDDWTTLANDSGVVSNGIHLISPALGSTISSNDKLVQFVNGVARKPDGIRVHAYDGNLGHSGPSVLSNMYSGRINPTKVNFPGQQLWVSEFGTNSASTPPDSFFMEMQDWVQPAFELDPDIRAYFQWYAGPNETRIDAVYPYRYFYDQSAIPTAYATHYKNNGG